MVNRLSVAPDLDAIFAALAHPIRRAILEQLSGRDATVSELAAPHRVSLPAISRHLGVLEDARLIKVEPQGRVRRCQIDAAPLSAAFGWLTRYRILWEDRLGRLATHLARGQRKSKAKEVRRKRHAN
jgi:DNA-binding transcriptional ArsR family regulator